MKTAIAYYSQHHGNTKKLLDAIKAADSTVELMQSSRCTWTRTSITATPVDSEDAEVPESLKDPFINAIPLWGTSFSDEYSGKDPVVKIGTED